MADLLLVEFHEDAAQAAALVRSGAPVVVALRPAASDALDALGVAHVPQTTIDQHGPLEEIAGENLRRYGRLAESSRIALADGQQWSPIEPHQRQVMMLMATQAFAAAQLRALVEAHRPATVSYFAGAPLSTDGIVPRPEESIWTAMCDWLAATIDRRPAWAAGIEWRRLPSGSSAQSVQRRIRAQDRDGSVLTYLKTLAGVRERVRRARTVLHVRTRRRTRPTPPHGVTRIVILPTSPDLAAIGGALDRDPGTEVWDWPEGADVPMTPRHRLDGALATADPAARARAASVVAGAVQAAALEWDGVPAAAAGSKWKALATEAPRTLDRFVAARRCLAALEPALLLHGEFDTQPWTRTVIEAAWSLRIPTVFQQWGGNYGYVCQPYLAYAELKTTWMLAYTAPAARQLRRQVEAAPVASARVCVGGAPYLARLRGQLRGATRRPARARRCVYVPAALTGHTRYGPSHALDDSLQHLVQQRIMTALAHPQADLKVGLYTSAGSTSAGAAPVLVKLAPRRGSAEDPLETWIRRRRLPAEFDRRPLDQLLAEPAVWVIDAAATTLQQVLLTGQPVVLVDTRGVRFDEQARHVLERSVTMLDAWQPDFVERLRAAVARLRDEPVRFDDAFTNAYAVADISADEACTHVVERLQAIAAERRPAPAGGRAALVNLAEPHPQVQDA